MAGISHGREAGNGRERFYRLHYPLRCHPERSRGICCLRDRDYFVYILASRTRVLYVGVTRDLNRRIREHKQGEFEGFTKKYRVHRLVYFESYRDVRSAIGREKQLRRWARDKKVGLIEAQNPTWEDLSESSADQEFSDQQSIPLRSGRHRSAH